MTIDEKGDWLDSQLQQNSTAASLAPELLTSPNETPRNSSGATNILQNLDLFDSSKAATGPLLSDAGTQFCDVRTTFGHSRQTAEGRAVQELVGGPDQATGTERYLGSRRYAQRIAAESEILRHGMAALPQLLHGTESADPEISRRCTQLIPRLLRQQGISADALLNSRNTQNAEDMFQSALGRMPSKTEQDALRKTIDTAIAERIAQPQSERNMVDYISHIGIGKGSATPADAALIRSFDHLDSPAGRRQLNDRLVNLAQINGHGNLTAAEQESIARQLLDIGQLMSPATVHNYRIGARMSHAYAMEGTPQEVRNFLMDTLRACRGNEGLGMAQLICRRNLDQDPQVMQAFLAAGGTQTKIDAVRAIQRQQQQQQQGWAPKK